ncbi:MAG: sulfatase-like hydrolase/transferase [Bryobacteraceae bacterium]
MDEVHSSSRRSFVAQAAVAAASAGAGPPRRPNILLLFPDQLRGDWIGNPAIPVRTPNLDALGRRGMRFTRAVVGSPVCAPSRACLASGREYDGCGVINNAYDYPTGQSTYYRILRDHGYHTMACGKIDLHKKTLYWGLDGKHRLDEWGFSGGVDNAGKRDATRSGAVEPKDPFMAFLHGRGLAARHVADYSSRKDYSATFPTPLPDDAYCDNWLANNGLELLRRSPRGKPWHLAVNFCGPHEPMDITAGMEKRVRGREFPQPNRNTQFPASTHTAIRQNYAAMIENIDRWVGIYMAELRRRGELDNTIVVFSSDHGEMLGDHDRWEKPVPYQASVGVPLIVAGPGETSDALVSVVDFAATFLDYAGVGVPRDMDSRSLRAVLERRTRSHREYVLSGLNHWRMVQDGRYKLITGFDDTKPRDQQGPEAKNRPPILFDHSSDPLENENAAARNEEQVNRLSKLLRG